MWIKEQAIAKALGRLIAAAAWADQKIAPEERECFKDLLYQMPAIEEKDWQELEALLDTPMSETEKAAAQEHFASQIRSEEERDFAFYALDQLVSADGDFGEEERTFLTNLRTVLDKLPLPTVGERIYGVLCLPVHRRQNRLRAEESSRDPELFREVLQEVEGAAETSSRRKAALCGALLSRVIHDGIISDQLAGVIRSQLQVRMGFTVEDAEAGLETAQNADTPRLDLLRLSRLFFTCNSYNERVAFLDVLFAVAENSDHFDTRDLDEIINLAANMRLSQEDFQIAFNRLLERWAPVIEQSELIDFKPRDEEVKS